LLSAGVAGRALANADSFNSEPHKDNKGKCPAGVSWRKGHMRRRSEFSIALGLGHYHRALTLDPKYLCARVAKAILQKGEVAKAKEQLVR
jgi:hypothetical protein